MPTWDDPTATEDFDGSASLNGSSTDTGSETWDSNNVDEVSGIAEAQYNNAGGLTDGGPYSELRVRIIQVGYTDRVGAMLCYGGAYSNGYWTSYYNPEFNLYMRFAGDQYTLDASGVGGHADADMRISAEEDGVNPHIIRYYKADSELGSYTVGDYGTPDESAWDEWSPGLFLVASGRQASYWEYSLPVDTGAAAYPYHIFQQG